MTTGLKDFFCDYCGSYEVECREEDVYCASCEKSTPKENHQIGHEIFPHLEGDLDGVP